MFIAAAFVLADTASAGYAGTADISNRVEVRARDTQGVLGADLADIPSARVDLTNRRWEYVLDYSAVAMLPDVELGASPQLLQIGDVGATWRSRRVRIGLNEYATYGEQNSGYLIGGPTPIAPQTPAGVPVGGGTQLAAQPVTLFFGSSRTVLASQLVLSRHWSGTASVEYSMQGGVDSASRAFLPFVTGPRADVTATFALTRVDAVETRASALESFATAGPCSPAALNVPTNGTCDPAAQEGIVTETWRHRLTRTWESTLGGGASVLRGRLRDVDSSVVVVYPVGSASIERATGPLQRRNVLRLEALVAPVLDVRVGLLDERAQATLDLSQRFGKTTVSGRVAAARSIESPFVQPATIFQASFGADVQVSKTFSVGGGLSYLWQEQGSLGRFYGGFVFAGVTARTPEIHF